MLQRFDCLLFALRGRSSDFVFENHSGGGGVNSELLNLYLFALAIFKASLITGLLPGVAVTLYMERKKFRFSHGVRLVSFKTIGFRRAQMANPSKPNRIIEFPIAAQCRDGLRKVL